MGAGLTELIELNDSDELLREIDRRCAVRNWDGLLELRDRCHSAVERGKQLWGVAAHAEYRLALEAPAAYVARVIESIPGRFAIGPLSEVAASTHSWDELRRFLVDSPTKALTAYERVVRGEDLSTDPELAAHVAMFELPMVLQDWEPRYPLAVYRPTEGRFERPVPAPLERLTVTSIAVSTIEDREATDALTDLTRIWVDESNGTSLAVAVEGGVAEALRLLEVAPSAAVRISPQDAIASMAWAGASGGAYGRRAGMASGRSKAWWAIAGVAGVLDKWPLVPEELGELSSAISWCTWDIEDATVGWSLRLVAVDSEDDVAFAIESSDLTTADASAPKGV